MCLVTNRHPNPSYGSNKLLGKYQMKNLLWKAFKEAVLPIASTKFSNGIQAKEAVLLKG